MRTGNGELTQHKVAVCVNGYEYHVSCANLSEPTGWNYCCVCGGEQRTVGINTAFHRVSRLRKVSVAVQYLSVRCAILQFVRFSVLKHIHSALNISSLIPGPTVVWISVSRDRFRAQNVNPSALVHRFLYSRLMLHYRRCSCCSFCLSS